MIAFVNLDFFLEAVFLCKIPFETALSHSLYAWDKAELIASWSFSLACAKQEPF